MSRAENYEVIHNQFGSYPNSLVKRKQKQDPSYPILKNLIEEEMRNGDVTISATSRFTSSDSTSVKIVTETEFGYSDTKGNNYQIAYVILEDNVGPYYQKNDYSAPSSAHTDHYMDWWIHQEYMVLMRFDHVARGIYPSLQGEKGSLPSNITAGQKYAHEYTVKLPDNIDDKRNIRVAVLLIDLSSNEILNACQTSIEGESSGINNVISDSTRTTAVYNLIGAKVRTNASTLDGLPKGIYIVGGKKTVKP